MRAFGEVLAAVLMKVRIRLGWDNAVEQWLARVNFVAANVPELQFPPIGDSEKTLLIEQVCEGATSYREIKDRPVSPSLKSWLNAEQAGLLEELAPERVKLPNGRGAKIIYGSDWPTIAARVQDLYGVAGSITIARGRIPLRIQVLAPNHRPIQITEDLETFWRENYPKIKKELQRKYPKHEWR